jgi:hypothetical protein
MEYIQRQTLEASMQATPCTGTTHRHLRFFVLVSQMMERERDMRPHSVRKVRARLKRLQGINGIHSNHRMVRSMFDQEQMVSFQKNKIYQEDDSSRR